MVFTILRIAFHALLALVAFTCIGQFSFKGKTLERHYHLAVNSPAFQQTFWVLVKPATWTTEKVEQLFREREEYARQKSAELSEKAR